MRQQRPSGYSCSSCCARRIDGLRAPGLLSLWRWRFANSFRGLVARLKLGSSSRLLSACPMSRPFTGCKASSTAVHSPSGRAAARTGRKVCKQATWPGACFVNGTPPFTYLQVIHWMRHGLTEMNVHLGKLATPNDGFKDPLL